MTNIDALFALLALCLLAGIYLGPWQALCTDYARQVIFEKRDRLFDMARDGELRFDSPEYRQIRRSLEQLIRFSHDLTLLNFMIVSWFMYRGRKVRQVSDMTRSVQAIGNAHVREKVSALVSDAHEAVLIMMIAKSVFSIPAALVIFYFAEIRPRKRGRPLFSSKPISEMIQVEAENSTMETVYSYAA